MSDSSLQLTSQFGAPSLTPSIQLRMPLPGSLQELSTLLPGTGLCCAWPPCSEVPYKLRGPWPISVQYSSLPFFKPLGHTFSIHIHSHNVSHNLSVQIGCSVISLFHDKLYAGPRARYWRCLSEQETSSDFGNLLSRREQRPANEQ